MVRETLFLICVCLVFSDDMSTSFDYLPEHSACRVTWQCRHCALSGKILPTFTLSSMQSSWANLYGFNFSTPVFSTDSGRLYDARLMANVSQIIFPTAHPVDDLTAFRQICATQRVALLLTGAQLTDGRNAVKYTAYQPSVDIVEENLLNSGSSPCALPYMTPESQVGLEFMQQVQE